MSLLLPTFQSYKHITKEEQKAVAQTANMLLGTCFLIFPGKAPNRIMTI